MQQYKYNDVQKDKILVFTDNLLPDKGETNLLHLIKAISEIKYSCTVVSVNDFPVKDHLHIDRLDIKILNNDYDKHFDKIIEYAKCFNLVIANNTTAYRFVDHLKNKVPLIWYINETNEFIEFIDNTQILHRHPVRTVLRFTSAQTYKSVVKQMIENNLADNSYAFNSTGNYTSVFKKKNILINLGFIKFRVTLDWKFLLKKIFSFSNEKNYKTLTFFWRKYRFEYLSLKNIQNINKFFKQNYKRKAVLIVELNEHHYETLSGYAKYFMDLGYNVDVVFPPAYSMKDPFVRFKSEHLHTYQLNKLEIKYLLKNKKLSSYNYIVFNSELTVNCLQDNVSSCFKYTGKIQKPQKDFVSIVHQPEYIDELTLGKSKNIILADLPVNMSPKPAVVNPHYFGDVKITPKNVSITDFIVIGNIQKQRKNHVLLINTVQKLITKGITNFKVTVIGSQGHLSYMPENVSRYIDFKGRLDFENMFDAMENADFFLQLLDPENPDHERYITTGTSGAFQLIYGFAKPCIICKKFAKIHGFTDDNSILYDRNNELMQAMITAINMPVEEYQIKQKMLLQYAQDLYRKSLDNLKGLLNGE